MVVVIAKYVEVSLESVCSSSVMGMPCVCVCRKGKMSVGQNVLEALRRNLTYSNHIVKCRTCDFSKAIRQLLNETIQLFKDVMLK